MESMYNVHVTKDGKEEYTKDIEIINPCHDQLAMMASEFVEMEDADYYAAYLKNTGMDLYRAELEKEAKIHRHRHSHKSLLHRVKRLMIKIQSIIGGSSHDA